MKERDGESWAVWGAGWRSRVAESCVNSTGVRPVGSKTGKDEERQQAGKESRVRHERWSFDDTYVKANATRAPLTTIKSRMFHRSRKYEP